MAQDAPPVPTIAVTIASRDRADALAQALEALGGVIPAGVEVLVVDSASVDGRTKAVADEAGVRCVRSDTPGLSVARNVAITTLDTDVVVFTDDDCRPQAGWVEALVAPFADPRVAFTTGPLHGAGGGTAADVVDVGDQRWRWPDDPLTMGSGANMAVRRGLALDVGGFDARLGAGAPIPSAEEHDLFLRLLHRGWEGAHVPTAVVEHHDHRSRWQTLRMFRGYGVGSGALCALATDLDRPVSRAMLRRRLWDHGVRQIAADLRRGWEEPAARSAAFSIGVIAGRVRGSRLRPRPLR